MPRSTAATSTTSAACARATGSDGVIHLAFKHDFYAGAGRSERAAVETLATALEGSDRPLLVASGVRGALAGGRVSTEADPACGHRTGARRVVAPRSSPSPTPSAACGR